MYISSLLAVMDMPVPCQATPALEQSEERAMRYVRAIAGGTIAKVVDDLVQRGASPAFIRVVAVVAAPPALKLLSEKFPGAPFAGAAGRQQRLQCLSLPEYG